MKEPDPEHLRVLALVRMPFGAYRGCYLDQLPEAYLLWFQRQGWPPGLLGWQLAEVLEIHVAGCAPLLRRIREMTGR